MDAVTLSELKAAYARNDEAWELRSDLLADIVAIAKLKARAILAGDSAAIEIANVQMERTCTAYDAACYDSRATTAHIIDLLQVSAR